jgi:succinate dehydrogenase/fumarate reductase flavoprotein subunit
MDEVYDVIVVGGGGSGLAAALSACQGRASVLLLEKHRQLGGATGIAVGSFTANRTYMQQQAGVQDSLDAHAEDAGLFAPPEIEARNNEQMRRWFLDHGAETFDWLTSMGLVFQGPNPEPPNRVPRMHNVVPGAKAYIALLHARLISLGGKVLTNAPVVDLVYEDRHVGGVLARVEGNLTRFTARHGVVLAAGDYANAPQMIARFKGNRFAEIEGINERATGDGHMLAERVGAKLVNMDVTYGPELRFIPPRTRTFQQLLPTQGFLADWMGRLVPLVPQAIISSMIRRLLVTWQHPENSLFEDGAILVNARGERFCDESVWPDREITIANQPGKICYILLDHRLTLHYSQWPHFVSTAPKIAYAYVKDYLKLRPDVTVKSATLKGIAEKRGFQPEILQQTVDVYNHQATRQAKHGLTEGPWILLGPAKAYFTTTEGGVAINRSFQVLDEEGGPIPGLYAVGQNGLGGQILWGHGLHIAWAMTSGRMVGELLSRKLSENT